MHVDITPLASEDPLWLQPADSLAQVWIALGLERFSLAPDMQWHVLSFLSAF